MGKNSAKSLEDKQLFYMFKYLKACAIDESDFSRVIGYSLFEALSCYDRPKNVPDEQVKFDEVKHFYNVLNKNINYCVSKGVEKVSLELMPVEEIMKSYLNSDIKKNSVLLEEIVEGNSFKRASKNFSAYIESRGYKAYRLVLDKGEFKGNKNILVNDYETLLNSFV
jgi:hypothetical protein